MVDYEMRSAMAWAILKSSKKKAWRQFCSSVGREIKLSDSWLMIKKMNGKRKSVKMPVLMDGKYLAITAKEKADLLGKKFQAYTVEVSWII